MAHFAKMEDNIVREIIVINNQVLLDEDGIEQELIGIKFCHDTFGGEWIQTSYNGNIRGKYASAGDFYDSKLDIFKSLVLENEA